ncbi:MAG: hypothetical protein K2I20_02970 [Clostridia bacterium]|nr:hypothetical protein [Clostridia bacterium]MDE6356620.1 hypothetical protein [Clostridia bacterium]
MKKAISTAGFNCETEAAAKQIKELGAQNAEISFKTFYEYRPEFSKRLAPEIAGLNVVSVRTFAPNFEYQLFSPSRRVRGDGFYWLDQLMRSMQLLGATRYVLQGAPFGGELTPERVLETLREVMSFCARYGVSVCLENDGVSAPRFYGRLKEICPEISFSLNLSKARLSGYPAQMFAAEMGSAISQICTTEGATTANLPECEFLIFCGNY